MRFTAVAGAAACVVVSIVIASGQVAGQGLAALGAAAFVLVVTWCFAHKHVAHSLVVLALYLGLVDGYVKLRTGSSTITLARDVLVVAVSGGALFRAALSDRSLSLPPLGGYVLAFSIVVIVELANPASRGLTAGLGGLRQHLEFMPLFFLGYAFVRAEPQIRTALFVVVLCAAVGGIVSYIQSRLTPGQLAAWGPGYASRIDGTGLFAGSARVGFAGGQSTVRPFGLGSEVGSGASLAALALPGLVALLMTGGARVRWAAAPLSIGIGLAVATSGSRAAIITAFVSLVAFGVLAAASKNGLKAVAGLTVGIVIVYGAFAQLGAGNASTKRAASITPRNLVSTFSSERGKSVGQFGGLLVGIPLGVGVGSVGPATAVGAGRAAAYNSETEWNFLVIETGIAGVAIYVSLLLRLLWLSVARIRRVSAQTLRLELAALSAPLFGMVVAGFSGPTSASVPDAPYFWLIAGVLSYWLITAARTSQGHLPKSDAPRAGLAG